MSIPAEIDRDDYFLQLRDFADQALEASNWHGRRQNLGGFVFGNAVAGWKTQDGGIADLEDAGFRFRSTSLTRLMSTTLRIVNTIGHRGHEITTYKMDLDDTGYIEVYRNMFMNGGITEVIRASISRRGDKTNDLHYPTDADRELIYTELQRGATGQYQTTRTHQ